MKWLRLSVRLTGFALFLTGTCALAIALRLADLVRPGRIDRTPWAARCFKRACQCLGFQIHVHGQPAERNALYVANHISWSDIPILGAITPLRFLSKAEVGAWPIIGWLARQAGTLFIQRGSGQARRVKTQISHCLNVGESVLVFPEGTTSNGVAVLPMHGLLLASARETGRPIQPVTIGYRRNHQPDALAPFVGDDSFHHHLIRLLKQPPTRVDIVIHPTVNANKAESTQQLTACIHQLISAGLNRIHAGEFEPETAADISTAVAPGLSRLPSPPGDRQFPDRNTA
ncbi:lysophospholipid acyltransferase family protein [Marinobacter halophilus]|uniref:1-acyl-sn-glycerol-3-phosphate acyltransferase n=1 Tax=Marinobacter halophilus TaxID=1323740 RepID=A0A2T1KB76_9GAMM|nr:lysophospholipid acyltransferase family protein [Marinobacter halophilus]PSF07401.1 1-acyl-sn-glycerol-3-phosphate acyltransferase [Marinobacter halophilus]GGC81295.1 1-acyl-sn-glycerol-3-phosphate acyltransferase [Marinobacter halophilus]